MALEIIRRFVGGKWQYVEEDSGGGSQPVSCVLWTDGLAGIDIHDTGPHALPWADFVSDNGYDQNDISGLPEGIGFTNPLDGSTGDLTFIEDGVWVFQLFLTSGGDDATLSSRIRHLLTPPANAVGPPNLQAVATTIAPVSSGTESAVFDIETLIAATTDPYLVTAAMTVIRIA